MKNGKLLLFCLFAMLVALLSGCGGGDGGAGTVSGVAAAGAPLSGTVYLKDSSVPAKERSMPIAADGSFSFNLNGLTAPFLMLAVGTIDGNIRTIYSFASGAGIANINPLAHLAVVVANGSADLTSLYIAPDSAKLAAIATALPTAAAGVRQALQPTLAKFGATDVDFLTGSYRVDHQGLDLMLDMVDISTSGGDVLFLDRQAGTRLQMSLQNLLSGSVDVLVTPVPTAGSVLLRPLLPIVEPGGSMQFKAAVVGNPSQQVTWRVEDENGGTITDSGFYTAPAISGTYHITATNTADSTRSATITVSVQDVARISIIPVEPGVYIVQAEGFANIGGILLGIIYDTTTLSNPHLTPGELVADRTTIANTTLPGIIRWAMLSITPIAGAGPLFTIRFDLTGLSPGRLVAMTADLVDLNGRRVPVVTTLQ